MRLVTLGGYGFDETRFIAALQAAEVGTFVDVRKRRGMRGKRYAFLNSKRLQASLADAGIRYVHLRELAPTQSVRDIQKKQDAATATGKRSRSRLSPEFVNAYRAEVLDGFDVAAFGSVVGENARVVALFCVEAQLSENQNRSPLSPQERCSAFRSPGGGSPAARTTTSRIGATSNSRAGTADLFGLVRWRQPSMALERPFA